MPADVMKIAVPGLDRPLRIAHVTDAHLCHADAGDPVHAARLGRVEALYGGTARWRPLFAELRKSAPDFIVFTGDMMHSATEANYACLQKSLARLDRPWAATFGNHEWDWPHATSRGRPGNWRERLARRWRNDYGHDPRVNRAVLGGVQVILLDNSDYQIGAAATAAAQAWLEAGPPALVFVHIPFDEPTLRGPAIAKWGEPILCGTTTWSVRGRERWGVAPHDLPSTTTTIARLREHPRVLGVFSGHLHVVHQATWGRGLQRVTRPAFEGGWTEICLTPEDPLQFTS